MPHLDLGALITCVCLFADLVDGYFEFFGAIKDISAVFIVFIAL
jgi:hypothetical protein